MKRKVDRRVLRTRKQLSTALLSLVMEREYETITIQEITDRADLNRATFYLHYGTKEELLSATLEQSFDRLVAGMETFISGQSDLSNPAEITSVFEHAGENSRLYQMLLGDRGQAYIINRIIDYIAAVDRQFVENCVDDVTELSIPIEVINHYTAGALFANLRWWLLSDMPHSAEKMGDYVCALCTKGVIEILNPQASEPPLVPF